MSVLGRYPRTKASIILATVCAVGLVAGLIAWLSLAEGSINVTTDAAGLDEVAVDAEPVASAGAAKFPALIVSSTVVLSREGPLATPTPTEMPTVVAPAATPVVEAASSAPLEAATATPGTYTNAATATAFPATPTPAAVVATPTVAVAATVVLPTSTPTPRPSATPSPTATRPAPTPTRRPMPTPTPYTRSHAS